MQNVSTAKVFMMKTFAVGVNEVNEKLLMAIWCVIHVLSVFNTRTCTDVYKVYLYANYLLTAGVHSHLLGPIPGQMACYKRCTISQPGD